MLISPNELMELLPGENVIKRYMKRTDLKGNKVKPKPIFNSEKMVQPLNTLMSISMISILWIKVFMI